MNGLDQFVTSIVEQTIESLHERGLLILNESEEENATRMFDGKIWLTLEDLRKHPACLWGRKKVRNLLQNHEIEDIGTNQQEKKEKEQEQQYKESLKNPDLSRPGQKRGVKEALNKVSKELAPEIRKAMADGKISTEESKDLSRQFIEAVKAQGIAYRGNLETLTSYFQETLNIIQQQAVNAAEAQKTTESLKAQLESVKKQVITIQRQRKNSR